MKKTTALKLAYTIARDIYNQGMRLHGEAHIKITAVGLQGDVLTTRTYAVYKTNGKHTIERFN